MPLLILLNLSHLLHNNLPLHIGMRSADVIKYPRLIESLFESLPFAQESTIENLPCSCMSHIILINPGNCFTFFYGYFCRHKGKVLNKNRILFCCILGRLDSATPGADSHQQHQSEADPQLFSSFHQSLTPYS